METIKARFVGGPKHNEIIEVSRLPLWRVVKPVPVSLLYREPLTYEPLQTETYFLCKFGSGYCRRDAVYFEYVHESLMRGSVPGPALFAEPDWPRLPDWYFSVFIADLAAAVIRTRPSASCS